MYETSEEGKSQVLYTYVRKYHTQYIYSFIQHLVNVTEHQLWTLPSTGHTPMSERVLAVTGIMYSWGDTKNKDKIH
jgi:hypothetical protein